MAEPDITGGGGPVNPTGGQRSGTAARLGAKVTVDGVEKLTGKFKDLLSTLKEVRSEIVAINNGGDKTAGNESTSRLGNMIRGFQFGGGSGGTPNGGVTGGGRGGFNPLAAVGLGLGAANVVNSRTQRNMAESAPISAQDALTASMYGVDYRSLERNRFQFSGSFGGSRQSQLQAFNIGLGYGQTAGQANQFMTSMGNVVQASGGTLSIGQAAQSAGDFMDPLVMRRAQALGIPLAKQGGQVMNPLETSMGYIRNFEQSVPGGFNEADYANLRSRGSRLRYMFQRRYGLDDAAIDQVAQAGMQNLTFRNDTGRNINFNNPDDLREAGLNEDVLGLRSQQLTTAVGRRESRFFANQESAMNRRLGQEITIQDTLADVEDAFGGIIGTLYQFENVIKGVMGALGALSAVGMLGGMGGMGGMGGGGVAAGAPGAVGQVAQGAAKTGGRMGAARAMLGKAGMIGGGAMLAVGGFQMAGAGSNATKAMGVASMTAGGAMIGSAVPVVGTGVGAAVGFAAGMGKAVYSSIKQGDDKSVQAGSTAALQMTDEELIASISDYVDGKSGGIGGAGPKQRGRFDLFTARRGVLMAAALEEAVTQKVIKNTDEDPQYVAKVAEIIGDMTSDKTKEDAWWRMTSGPVKEIFANLRKSKAGQDIYRKYFGNVEDPYSFEPVKTQQYQSLIMNNQQLIEAHISQGGSGDPDRGGSSAAGMSHPTDKGVGPGNASWDKLDGRMKERLQNLISASGGRVWVGEGWRDPEGYHEAEFFRRHYEDPNGSRTYKGKRYSLRDGYAPLAPPGQSNHNIGLAADLQGDITWVEQNASRFGLKTFAEVNNEPWHVQLSELANGFLGEGAYQGTGGSNEDAAAMAQREHPLGGGGGAGGVGEPLGIRYDILARSHLGGGGGGGFAGTGASTTGGMMGGGNVPGYSGSGPLTAEQVAMYAYQAGFRGQDLVTAVAIAGRESSFDPGVLNPNAGTKDYSLGLMQINMLGDLGPARRKQFGISSNEALYDPATNMRAAFMMYQEQGFYPWGPYKGLPATYNTDVEEAARAVASAGYPTGDPGNHAMRPEVGTATGGGMMTVNLGGVTINSGGNPNYDADAFLAAVAPRLEEAAGMMMKRSGG